MQEKSLVPSPMLQNLKIKNDLKKMKNMILLTSLLDSNCFIKTMRKILKCMYARENV